jgi:phosphatidylserine/phosphatidylglycerophosphate/cardiolipin synthase-like enzyme
LRQDKGLPANHYAKAKLLSENQIKAAMLELINKLDAGDSLDVAMFYLSDRQVVTAIKQAANRGVAIRLILDPNKDAFGYQKNGIPNRSVACELHRQANIDIRWYDTDGEQFHSKLIIAKQARDKTVTAILGSANVTKRNLAAYNLELDVLISTRSDLGLALQFDDYFQTLFYNRGDALYTVDYNRYADCSLTKTWLYRWQEFSGLSSF